MKLTNLLYHINVCLEKTSKYVSFILDRMRWSFHKRHGKLLWNTFEWNFSKSMFFKLCSTTVPKPAFLNSIIYLHNGVAMTLTEIWTLASFFFKKKKEWSMLSWHFHKSFLGKMPGLWEFLIKLLICGYNENTTIACGFGNRNGASIMSRYSIALAQVRFLHLVVDI